MTAKTSKKEKRARTGPSGDRMRLIICILLAAACAALFLIFGLNRSAAPSSGAASSPSPAQQAEPSAVPKGVPMGRFISTLGESGMDCEIGEVTMLGGNDFAYPLTLPDGREGAELAVRTDSIGRVAECTLSLPYIYAGEPDASFSEITSSAIRAEYRRREKADTALVSAYLNSIYEQLSDDLGISTIDGRKIADAIESAYYSRKNYDKKAGAARFYCETECAEENEFAFTFRVIASFNYSN
ncbi:MAG: hypothetical protein IKI64_10865 [Clostridia bacterium]|nr:hypothetical protein [Clostridia bacterium]